jgi:hypothetical protein
MQQEFHSTSEQRSQSSSPQTSAPSNQHGFLHHEIGHTLLHAPSSRGSSPRSTVSSECGSVDGVNADQLGRRLRRLSDRSGRQEERRVVPGQRVWDYENALTPSTPRQPLGFKVIKRPDSQSLGPKLTDFPNGEFLGSCHS